MVESPDDQAAYVETKQAVTAFKKGLTQYVGSLERGDEGGAARASAQTVGAYRKIVARYRELPVALQEPLKEPLLAMYGALRTLEIPVGDPPVQVEAETPTPEPRVQAQEA
ncbi:MAG: hypothetical protein VKP72_06735 [bacterium]|nr:hypothetical protein [bacterium]